MSHTLPPFTLKLAISHTRALGTQPYHTPPPDSPCPPVFFDPKKTAPLRKKKVKEVGDNVGARVGERVGDNVVCEEVVGERVGAFDGAFVVGAIDGGDVVGNAVVGDTD